MLTTGRLVPLLGALALAAVVAGCSSSSSSRSGAADAKAFCLDVSETVWDKMQECGMKVPPRPEVPFYLGCQIFQQAQDTGRAAYHAAAAADCVGALENLSCVDARVLEGDSFDVLSRLPASCRSALEPTVEIGGACSSFAMSFECIDGYCEVGDYEQCVAGDGTCTAYLAPGDDCEMGGRCPPGYTCDGTCLATPALTVLGPGGDCSAENTVCRDGLYCDGAVCAPRVKAGQSCSDAPCLEGLLCNDSTCIARVKSGKSCAGGDCAAGLYCNAGSVCAPYPVAGESCDGTDSIDDVYCDRSFCNPDAGGGPTCEPYVLPGDWCPYINESLLWEECGPGLMCTYAGLDDYGVCALAYCPYS